MQNSEHQQISICKTGCVSKYTFLITGTVLLQKLFRQRECLILLCHIKYCWNKMCQHEKLIKKLLPSVCLLLVANVQTYAYMQEFLLVYINKIQRYATVCRYLFTAKSVSTCFGCPSRPSSGEHKTVTAASGTGHSI